MSFIAVDIDWFGSLIGLVMGQEIGLTFTLLVGLRGAQAEVLEGQPNRSNSLVAAILFSLEGRPGMDVGELCRSVRRDVTAVSRGVRLLVKKGLVNSQIDRGDHRRRQLFLSKEGSRRAQGLLAAEARLLNRLAKEWGRPRVNQFLADLREFDEFLFRVGS